MVEWRKGLGTGRCGMNVPHVDYTERRTPARGAVRKPPVLGLSSSSEEGGREEERLPGDHNLSSRFGHA